MKLEHKIGIAVTCTFLCLSGAVIGLKMQEQTPAETPPVASTDVPPPEATPLKESTPPAGAPASDDAATSPKRNPKPSESIGGLPPPATPATASPSSAPPSLSRSSQSVSPPLGQGQTFGGASMAGGIPPPTVIDTKPTAAKENKAEANAKGNKQETQKDNIDLGGAGSPSAPYLLTSPTPLDKVGTPAPGPRSHPIESPTSMPTEGGGEWSNFSKPTGKQKAGSPPSPPAMPGSPTSTTGPSTGDKPAAPVVTDSKVTPAGAEEATLLPPLPSSPRPASPGKPSTPDLMGSSGAPTPPPLMGSLTSSTGATTPSPGQVPALPGSKPVNPSFPPTMGDKAANAVKDPGISANPYPPPPPSAPSAGSGNPGDKRDPLSAPPGLPPLPAPPVSIPSAPTPTSPPAGAPAVPSLPSMSPLSPPPAAPMTPPSASSMTPLPLGPTTTPSPTTPTTPTPVAPLTPAPSPTATTPPAPPKPPAEGSPLIPDVPPSGTASSGSAPGRLSAVPAPLPSAPVSVPLTPGADKQTASAGMAAPPRSANNGASVQVFDEMEYTCQPNDSFASISKKFLLSENYAKALQRHNQQHARASEKMADSGKLTPGEKIYIPQAYVLENRYADAIPNPKASASPPASPLPGVVPASATGGPPPQNP